ncbi:hypothetical protein VTP01DRAFT_1787 [Rhizomucor pusillus]|uniref:uncharacterized protein n=1 Tax=Rhizomucor pusillus TaxID=4840 RepID=UPI003742CB35
MQRDNNNKLVEEWSECLKSASNETPDLLKTAKAFINADTFARNTAQALDRSIRALEQLKNEEQKMESTIATLKQTRTTLSRISD